jgi:SpoVK/Ycf46/Vps4 family AAA+-type ATPase
LQLADYDHIAPSIAVLRPYLKHAIASNRKGVNVFLYGPPGTGKSELARALAKDLGCELFEVASEDSDGDPVVGERRLRAFRAAQSFFAQCPALILFDEVEDIFNDGAVLSGRRSTAQTRKAWINRVLEENPVPALWLSNCIHGVDPAFIRRFDMVLELPVPPRAQRKRIIGAICSDVLDAASVTRIAESESLTPAVVAKATAVVRSIHGELADGGATGALELLIKNTLKAQGHKMLRSDSSRLQDLYDPAFIHADADLIQITRGLIQSKSGRLCLYGPPGTGKTAYGRWVAEQIGIPLIVKKASDLMSKWVGENEKNIANAFKQAEQDGALLLIDEVDSFLQDRRGAHTGWEVTLVNEMLTQMEEFSGVFIASTNLMDGLDQAALRRFDLKVKFDFLDPGQAWELVRRYCARLAIAPPGPMEQARLAHLGQLTPGDFAAVLRQSRFRPITASTFLLDALEAECAIKPRTKAAIGF